jgi:hypothetical protein
MHQLRAFAGETGSHFVLCEGPSTAPVPQTRNGAKKRLPHKSPNAVLQPTSSSANEIEAKGHGHALIRHYYKIVYEKWKLAGLKTTVHRNEGNFELIFKGH